ncbi:PF10070 domain protein [Anopheles sinensis]|uniref:PF10070 domain protein n=1 Tax=Anopheles sinensis TaxID=74873 RepID=A0A084W4J3_ANOSI|nr:PF10070 domain protein [Anopheles sinensis]
MKIRVRRTEEHNKVSASSASAGSRSCGSDRRQLLRYRPEAASASARFAMGRWSLEAQARRAIVFVFFPILANAIEREIKRMLLSVSLNFSTDPEFPSRFLLTHSEYCVPSLRPHLTNTPFFSVRDSSFSKAIKPLHGGNSTTEEDLSEPIYFSKTRKVERRRLLSHRAHLAIVLHNKCPGRCVEIRSVLEYQQRNAVERPDRFKPGFKSD